MLSKRSMNDLYISFDMDETLLHSKRVEFCEGISRKPDATLKLGRGGEDYQMAVYLRYGVHDLLTQLREMGRLNIFTMGVRPYAHAALKSVGLISFFDRVFTREDCWKHSRILDARSLEDLQCSRTQASGLKDLRMVHHDVSRVVALDDIPSFYPAPQRHRVIPVPEYSVQNPWFYKTDPETWLAEIPCLVSKMAA